MLATSLGTEGKTCTSRGYRRIAAAMTGERGYFRAPNKICGHCAYCNISSPCAPLAVWLGTYAAHWLIKYQNPTGDSDPNRVYSRSQGNTFRLSISKPKLVTLYSTGRSLLTAS